MRSCPEATLVAVTVLPDAPAWDPTLSLAESVASVADPRVSFAKPDASSAVHSRSAARSGAPVSTYRSRILSKLRLRTNADLVRYALEHRLAPASSATGPS